MIPATVHIPAPDLLEVLEAIAIACNCPVNRFGRPEPTAAQSEAVRRLVQRYGLHGADSFVH